MGVSSETGSWLIFWISRTRSGVRPVSYTHLDVYKRQPGPRRTPQANLGSLIMDNEFQKRWERIQQALAAELSGEAKPRVSSGRTLFGIKSEGETKMDAFAKQIEEEYAAKRRAEKETPSQSKNIHTEE